MQILCFGVPNINLKTFKDKMQRAQAPLKRLQGLYEDETSVSRYLGFHLAGEERVDCFALFVFLVSRDCCVALPHDTTDLSTVYDCNIS